eukprot:gene13586-biopygen12108
MCVTNMHYEYALRICVTNMHYEYAFRIRVSDMRYEYALRICVSNMRYGYALRILPKPHDRFRKQHVEDKGRGCIQDVGSGISEVRSAILNAQVDMLDFAFHIRDSAFRGTTRNVEF